MAQVEGKCADFFPRGARPQEMGALLRFLATDRPSSSGGVLVRETRTKEAVDSSVALDALARQSQTVGVVDATELAPLDVDREAFELPSRPATASRRPRFARS